MSTETNKRTDKWGGSLENRARLLIETVRAIKNVVPSDFIVGVRVSPEDTLPQRGFDIDETARVVEWLVQLEVDYIHISAQNAAATSWKYPESSETNLHRLRKLVPSRIALIGCGGVKTAKDADLALGEGADLIAIGKTAINTQDWPLKAQDPGYMPKAFPMSEAEATAVGITGAFTEMLTAFHLLR